ncbi:MAG: energy-coupling factor transporter ATPase [Candidatus Odinarchaeota archaeon]|nr:energy-coupling factor transporter ATPase [Candidatus Odinarchaeota archaeon]
MTDPYIVVEDLSFTYPDGTLALEDISLEIYEGEFVAIIGQNGSGKTTLVKHFNGLLKPTKGRVIVDGVDTRKATVAELARKVGYLFQNPDHQIFSNTIEEEIAFGPRNLGLSEDEIKERVEEALEIFELTKIRKENPIFRSKGEKTRIALASIVAMRPKVLILDEPTTGLDWRQSEKVMQYVKKMHDSGHIIIFITHDMRIVAEYAKRVIVMHRGRILLEGDVRDVFAQPEILKETFLFPPQITQYAHALKRNITDKEIPKSVLTVREMLDVIQKLFAKYNIKG